MRVVVVAVYEHVYECVYSIQQSYPITSGVVIAFQETITFSHTHCQHTLAGVILAAAVFVQTLGLYTTHTGLLQ